MRDERTCAGTTGDALQNRSLHLSVSCLIEEVAHGLEHLGTLEECILHTVVDDEVDIALAGAQLRIIELVVSHTILVFHDRQRLEALAQQFQ